MYGKIDTFNAEYDSFHQLNIMHLQNENLFLQNMMYNVIMGQWRGELINKLIRDRR